MDKSLFKAISGTPAQEGNSTPIHSGNFSSCFTVLGSCFWVVLNLLSFFSSYKDHILNMTHHKYPGLFDQNSTVSYIKSGSIVGKKDKTMKCCLTCFAISLSYNNFFSLAARPCSYLNRDGQPGFTLTNRKYSCVLCKLGFEAESAFNDHKRSKTHNWNYIAFKYQEQR